MKKMNKKITCAILAAAMLGTALTGCSKEEEKLDGTQTVMTVGDHEVTLGFAHLILRENQAAAEDYMEDIAAAYGMEAGEFMIWDDIVDDGDITYGQKQKDQVMGSIVEWYATIDHAEDYDVALTEEDNTKIAAAAAQFMKDNTQEAIDALGVSESDIVTYLEIATIRARMQEPMLADVDRNVTDKEANQTTVTYVAISTLGTEKDEDGKTISLTDAEKAEKKALAQDIIDAIKKEDDIAKADISKIVKEISEDATVSTKTYTTSEADEQYAVNEVVWKAVEDMKDGELCEEVLEAANSYYVVRLDAAVDKEATEDKKEEIIAERESEAFSELVDKWVSETKYEVKYDVWAQVELTDKQSFRYTVEEETEDKE